ncbi:glucokinase [Nodosilinea sp. LEGE 07088]|uniref:glucokinase n=1 Tax=Nodosilinea sp. LEGE 07088 TaxID=2777968 RepID=UPI00187FECD7|nr:glucokinase [Nodosilinea sp. LEGE 07088]MBE9140746.1 glucokinase [Nodosilinea sp. LEGE 07088]
MTYLLAGDIGGTKTILRLVQASQPNALGQAALKTQFERTYSSQAYPDLVPMVKEFLHQGSEAAGQIQPPVRACFAIAGPVVENTSSLTNLAWSLEGDRLKDELGLDRVELINDFEAIGYGVFGLTPSDIHTLQAGDADGNAPVAIIGAGTGLGQGFALCPGGQPLVFPSEGGHADFAPRSELEFQLMRYLLDKHQISRVSVERVVSGQGIVAIYQFLRDREFASETPAVAEAITTWERQTGLKTKTVDPAAVIAQAAAAGRDRLCQKAMEIFVSAYGAEAGNLALKLLPYGGLYVAGGIAAKNLPLLTAGAFSDAFTHKGRVSPLLDRVPVHIVLNPQVGLIGAALKAANS